MHFCEVTPYTIKYGILASARCSAHMDVERIPSYFISTDHAGDHDPYLVSAFDLKPGSTFDSDSGSIQNIHNSPPNPPPRIYNEFFHLIHRSVNVIIHDPILGPFSDTIPEELTFLHRKHE
ncbi:hypothetical protein EVAR_22262_1 [Eumeta japonica]|uniref:Uncharacterized protein n=1 Tax=Eumeta variegata TaxID=151549 RepID=A0A4C1UAD8_EUMVA|nr:hypothetical protein EVAR_22262_1 [Eumeta japonica]